MIQKQDLPLRDDIAARFVPKIVALMVYLGTLCFVFTLFMIHSTSLWESQLKTHLTLEIPNAQHTTASALQAKALNLLTRTPGIISATVVPQEEISALIHGLLGEQVDTNHFALPVIIDVTLSGTNEVDVKNLEAMLKNISPGIHVTDHRTWQDQVVGLIHSSIFLALIVTFLILIVTLATTAFAARTSLLIHRQVIDVLALIGATPMYIAKQFQMNTLRQGLIASSIGSFLAFLTFLSLFYLMQSAGFSVSLSSSFFIEALVVFILAPFLTSGAMMASARFSVLKELNQ